MYYSANNIKAMKLRGRMKVGEECSTHERAETYMENFSRKKLKGVSNLEGVYVTMRMILKWILNKYCVRKRTCFSRIRIRPNCGLL
jgi:hypothetical protein